MEERRYKLGWSAKGIIGLVFLPLGLLFLALGILFWRLGLGNDPEDPMVFLLVFGINGLIYTVIGAVMLALELRARGRKRAAIDSGHYVTAKVAAVTADLHVRVSGRSPSVLECHWTDPSTGILHVYTSRRLYFTPPQDLIGREIRVFTDPMDENAWYVDAESAMPEVKIHR